MWDALFDAVLHLQTKAGVIPQSLLVKGTCIPSMHRFEQVSKSWLSSPVDQYSDSQISRASSGVSSGSTAQAATSAGAKVVGLKANPRAR